MFVDFKKWVKNKQTTGYNAACTNMHLRRNKTDFMKNKTQSKDEFEKVITQSLNLIKRSKNCNKCICML